MSRVEIVAVGRELVTGVVTDTNSAWLAAQLTALGATVSRIVVVDDDAAAIAHEIRAARGLVITTGGLGPTLDDRTLAGIAAALGKRLVEDPAAVAFVARRYAELARAGLVADGALTPPRRKMARLPEGAEPVDNPVGTAPGVFLADGVLALPGVPDEMRAVFAAALPGIRARLGGPADVVDRDVQSGFGDESAIADAIARVMDDVPGVYLKSFATTFAPGGDLRIRITARATNRADAEALVERAASRLAAELARLRQEDPWNASATSPPSSPSPAKR
jgi:molybdenum cofactor synthesis domain-containing protein